MINTMCRRLAVIGLTILMGATLAATASPASAASAATTGSSTVSAAPSDHGWYTRYRSYDSRGACLRAGWRGENRDWWEGFRCVRSRGHHDWGHDWDRNWGLNWWHGRDWGHGYTLWVKYDRHHHH